MSTVDVDSRGRVYIPKDMREEFGESFKVVKLDSGIKLIPLDDDPVDGLRSSMEEAEDLELDGITREAQKKAKKEVKDDI